MPLLKGRGDVLSGGGGTQGYLNKVPLPFQTYGGGSWLTDDTVLLLIPKPAPVNAVLAYWHPGDPAPFQELDRGANDFAAGGGIFTAWLAGYGAWGTFGTAPLA